MPITVPAKTVADCFKYLNKIGIDIAIEALRDLMKARPRPNLNEIYRCARLDRVQAVMRPYVEAIVWAGHPRLSASLCATG